MKGREISVKERSRGKAKFHRETSWFLPTFFANVLFEQGNLDISWLQGENANKHDAPPQPDIIAAMLRERLVTAMKVMGALAALLETSETG